MHWCILQNVSNINSLAFSMKSSKQATRKKSFSSTCRAIRTGKPYLSRDLIMASYWPSSDLSLPFFCLQTCSCVWFCPKAPFGHSCVFHCWKLFMKKNVNTWELAPGKLLHYSSIIIQLLNTVLCAVTILVAMTNWKHFGGSFAAKITHLATSSL